MSEGPIRERAGRYRLEARAGSGAAGLVHRATDLQTSSTVALKEVRATEPGLRARVRREAEILGALEHPHVVRLLDQGSDGDGDFLVFEWLQGRTLNGFEQPPAEASVGWARAAASGLAAAHAAGVVHRDVKPENLFVTDAGPLKVIDFGVAKAAGKGSLTHAGAILGTPSYMAPEQGAGASAVDARADVFGLGVVLFELLTDQLPWEAASDLARLARILSERAPALNEVAPHLPPELGSLVDGMLERDPSERVPTMEAVIAGLDVARAQLRLQPRGRVGAALAQAVFEQPTDFALPPILAEAEPVEEVFVHEAMATRVQEEVERALAEPRGLVLAVVGPAGAGKSTLRRHLTERLARTGGPKVFAETARPEESSVSHAFVSRLLRHFGRFERATNEDQARQAVERLVPARARLARLWADATPLDERALALPESGPSQRMFTAERLADLGGGEVVPGAGDAERQALVRAMLADLLGVPHPEIPPVRAARRSPRHYGTRLARVVEVVLRGLAERRGMIILIDDAHQLDRASAQILRGLMAKAESAPLACVGFGPRQLLDRQLSDFPEGAKVRNMPGLDEAGAKALLQSWAPMLVGRAEAETLIEHAGELPLFFEHVVASLRVSPEMDLPPTIAAAISNRVGRLEPARQRALTAAAVFESDFSLEGWGAVLGAIPDPGPWLRERWIRQTKAGRFELSHRVLRTVALSRVPRAERRRYERSVATHLAAHGASEAVVARHLVLAGATEEALARLAAASELSLARGDAAAARALSEDGLDRVEQPQLEARLASIAFEAAHAEGDHAAAAAALERWRSTGLRPAQAELASSRHARALGRPAEALAGALRVLEVSAEDETLAALRPKASRTLARAAETLGDLDRAEASYSGGEDPSDLIGAGRVAMARGALDRADTLFAAALESARAAQLSRERVRALLGRAEVARRFGGLEQARSFLAEASDRAPDVSEASRVRIARVALLPEEERYDDALVRLDWMEGEVEALDVRLMIGVLRGRCLRHHERLGPSEERLTAWAAGLQTLVRYARSRLPALGPSLEQGLALTEWLLGAPSEAAERMQRIHARVAEARALVGEELCAFGWTHARLLAASGGDEPIVQAALREALAFADEELSAIPARRRRAFLDRPLLQGLLDEAERHGVATRFDRARGRLEIDDIAPP